MRTGRPLRYFGSICGALLLLGSVWAGSTHAATYYVATSGHDANPGTEASPMRTLNKGVTKLHPGDTLYVKSGTYVEALNNKIPGGTSWSNPVTVAAYPGDSVTLRPSAGTSAILYFAGADRQYIVVDGLILDGMYMNKGHGILIGHAGTNPAQGAHHIRIKNTEIKNIPQSGVDLRIGSDFNELLNLRVHDTGLSGTGHGFYIHSHHNVVEQSQIYDNKKCGIQFYHEYGPVNHNIFRYNQVSNNGKGGSTRNPCRTGLWVGAGTGMLVYNNLIWDNQDRGLVVDNGVSDAKVCHNIIYGNGSTGLYIYGRAKALIKDNIVCGIGQDKGIYNKSLNTILTNNLTANLSVCRARESKVKVARGDPADQCGGGAQSSSH
jgi:hypothetical protein